MRATKKGCTGHPHTPEARAKISAAMQGKRHALGAIRSPETRSKIGAHQLGKRGALSHSWKGGRRKMTKGYIRVFAPDHPFSDPGGYVLEHRLVMEKTLGRSLGEEEVVHHANGIKDDNRPENLVIFPSEGAHTAFHRQSGVELVGRVPDEITKA